MPTVKEYTKKELRMLLANPHIDTSDVKSMIGVKAQSAKLFTKRVTPIIESSGLCTLTEFKSMRKVPVNIVRVIFAKLL